MDQLIKFKYTKSYYAEIQNREGEKTEGIWTDANDRYQRLVQENSQLPDKVKEHTVPTIFPAIAVYQALLDADPENAMSIMETAEDRVSVKTGESYRKLLGPRWMRTVFLRIFSWGAKKGFSEASGFENHILRDEKNDIAFNMARCPYHDYCVKYGCPELPHIFCHNDINAYGNLPGIVFERHETLGTGGTCCDFHLYFQKE